MRCVVGWRTQGSALVAARLPPAPLFWLELSASDDLIGFKQAIEEDGSAIDEASFWYGGSSDMKMGFIQKTPLMNGPLFGNIDRGINELNELELDYGTRLEFELELGKLGLDSTRVQP
ncbi:Zinc finger CCCH domain-containing protein 29 [Nymphaea thermarum]|nr:Zinc finger CCCH domain-containing protein 29 [Nymphaea thermarum]